MTRIKAVQPCCSFPVIGCRGRVTWIVLGRVCVYWSVLSYAPTPGWSPVITGRCGCRGSTALAQDSLCSFYSCQATDWAMYSKQCCFLTVRYLLYVLVARAAVNKRLENCCSFVLFFYNFVFSAHLVHAMCHTLLFGRCVYRRSSSVSAIGEINVMVTVLK